MPFSEDNQYLVHEVEAHLLAGGRSFVSVNFAFLRVHFFADVVGYKFTPASYTAKLDVATYVDFCH